MSFARQSPSKQGREANEYCRDGKFDALYNKKGAVEEDSCILMGEQNMLPNEVIPYEDQMEMYWDHVGNPRHKNEVRRFIFSFAPDEIDCRRYPNGEFVSPDAPYKALEICEAYCQQTFPDRQVAFYVQADGKRSKNKMKDGSVHPVVHVHAIVNDWSMIDGKGLPTYQTDSKWLAHSFSDFVKSYTFENGDAFHVTKNQDKNLASLDAGYKPNRYHEKRVKESWFEKQRTVGDIEKINEDGYYNSYKDYLVDMINEAKGQALSFDEFESYLSERGIDIEHKSSKKKGDFIKYKIRDEFIYRKDADNSKAVVMAPKTNNASIGDEKLSKWADADMGYAGIQAAIKQNVAVAPVAEPVPVVSEPEPAVIIPEAVTEEPPVAEEETIITHHRKEEPAKPEKTEEDLQREAEEAERRRKEYEEALARTHKFYNWCEAHNIDPNRFPDDDTYYRKARNRYDIFLEQQEEQAKQQENQTTDEKIEPVNEEIPVSEQSKSHTETEEPEKVVILPVREKTEEEKAQERMIEAVMELGNQVLEAEQKQQQNEDDDSPNPFGRRKF